MRRRGINAGFWSPAGMFAALLLASASATAAGDSGAHILYFEPLRVAKTSSGTGAAFKSGTTGETHHLSFEAYGKSFSIAMDENTRLSPLLKSTTDAGPALKLYRGHLEDVPASWVRLSERDGQLRGMLWDGNDLYVVESADQIHHLLVAPLDASSTGTVIFRLSDTLMDTGAAFCASDEVDDKDGDETSGSSKAADAYNALVSELKGNVAPMQAANLSARLEISALGDAQFLQRFASAQQASDEILLRLNNVDGIFSSQLGLEIQVPTVDVRTASNDPFTSTTFASSLLGELGKLRKHSAELRARGLTHLFTGRNLAGSTIGIAYMGSVCHQEYGAGLTEVANSGAWFESLIAAHEIGHNLGAVHDGHGSCAQTPNNSFLMSPNISGNRSTFSSCSLGLMQPEAQEASCVTALAPADLAIPADLGTLQRASGRAFQWELSISNTGGASALNARVEVTLPPSLTVTDAYVTGGSCTSGAGITFCQLGGVAGGTSRMLRLTLQSDVLTTNPVSARVLSEHDATTSNNSAAGSIVIEAEADVAVVLQAPASVIAGVSFDASFTVSNVSSMAATDLKVLFELPSDVTVSAAALASGTCNVATANIQCSLSSLAAGAALTGTLSLVAAIPGSATLSARVSGGYIDPISSNDTATQSVLINPVPAEVQTKSVATGVAGGDAAAGGGGGGGSTGLEILLSLAILHRLRRFSIPVIRV